MNRTDDECYTGTGPAGEVAASVHGHSVGEASAKGPAELWLQLHGDCTPDELTEPVDYTGGDVTWCWHQIHDSDVRYVRADLAQANAPSPTYAELLAQRDELADALRWRDPDEEPPAEGQEVLVAFSPYNNPKYRRVVASAVFLKGRFLDSSDDSPMHWPICWAPLELPEALSRIKGA
jgi:hypothetical protein